jgi:hypothetical protein
MDSSSIGYPCLFGAHQLSGDKLPGPAPGATQQMNRQQNCTYYGSNNGGIT